MQNEMNSHNLYKHKIISVFKQQIEPIIPEMNVGETIEFSIMAWIDILISVPDLLLKSWSSDSDLKPP